MENSKGKIKQIWHQESLVKLAAKLGNVKIEIQDKAEAAIKNYQTWNLDALIAIGGDGTMHEVINGIMRVPKEKRENLII